MKGEYSFSSFQELYLWSLRNFKRPKGIAGSIALAVAENGYYSSHTAWRSLEITSDVKLGYKAKEIAREIGLLISVIGGDEWTKDADKGLKFAQHIVDEELKRT
ncbi:hypothetical protein H5T51_08635 [Candidatus Bathyarchaeota archaeon]|nr:hypothetical protein [Candidatus Bathyarchaeota archaeon]